MVNTIYVKIIYFKLYFLGEVSLLFAFVSKKLNSKTVIRSLICHSSDRWQCVIHISGV